MMRASVQGKSMTPSLSPPQWAAEAGCSRMRKVFQPRQEILPAENWNTSPVASAMRTKRSCMEASPYRSNESEMGLPGRGSSKPKAA